MHYYPFNLKDYLVQTAHLPPLADLAYRRLLDLYYLEEGPIPNKPKWVANRIRLESEEAIIGFVLREFFALDGVGPTAFWRHDTCEKNIAKYQKKAAVARENGPKHVSGTKKEPKSVTDRFTTNNHKPRTKKNTPLPPEGELWWAEFWQAYPRKAKKPDALRAFGKALGRALSFGAMMDGLRRHIGCDQWLDPTKVPYPASWLNGDCWNDEPAKAAGQNGAHPPGGWWTTRRGLEERAIELGLPAAPADDPHAFMRWKAAVWVAAGDGPWWDDKDAAYAMAVRMRGGDR